MTGNIIDLNAVQMMEDEKVDVTHFVQIPPNLGKNECPLRL